ncbi:hypothetical protein ACFP1I_10780 [Dyadobacter subterraneus]|uniref:Lipoprotein n=1 Tax=Dyadobacter subterraneus TaxID=2773304 RepID=A0ABR9WDV8_9BACT|nr:hypothetical protein [Dyadobacter subterraneus]MBE9462409.1 hypothetical protein [Dyadobacter subterraneus]
MKKIIILIVLWFASLSCHNKNEEPHPQESSTSASYRKLTSVTVSGALLAVTVLEVNDSRCPINADCISAGTVKVKFNISDEANSTEALIELINDDKTVQSFKLGDQSYYIKIHEVSPYPEIFKTINLEDYKVSLTIEKL